MLFKLSIKNIKKSIKDYSIYFFTLVFAIAMFYMFNSLEAQNSMLILSDSKKQIILMLVQLLSYISVFVSVILGFLIIYSNNFLIKRRKKEIGLYFTLGMSKRKVSLILVLETIVIGLVSLLVGLLFGIFLSQFSSIFVAKLFELDMQKFTFIFSVAALKKTILYFGLAFVFVIVFNVITLSRYKLIDLLNASKTNEKIKFRNKYVTLITFIVSIGLIAYAYSLLFGDGLVYMDYRMAIMLITGAFGTFLLFYSLAGFLLKIIQKSKRTYYKNLNMFTLKQVNNKINTTVVSTTIICLMLLLTISVLSGCLSFAKAFNTDLQENNLVDYTYTTYNGNYDYDSDGNELPDSDSIGRMKKLTTSGEFDKYSKEYVMYYRYNYEKLQIDDLMTEKSKKALLKEYGEDGINMDFPISIMSESDYKAITKLLGMDALEIKDNQYLLLCNIAIAKNAFTEFYETKQPIDINGTKLTPASDKISEIAVENSPTANNDGIVVVKDELIENTELMGLNTGTLIGYYVNPDLSEKEQKEVSDFVVIQVGSCSYTTKTEVYANSLGIKVMAIFIGLYLGIVFAVSSATILAIGQLSESSDNKSRYRMIRRLGADEKTINKALMSQIAIVFMFPLAVALFHSYFALKRFNGLIGTMTAVDLTSSIIGTIIFMLIVYGGYYLITYYCSKNIIKEN